MDMTAEQKKIWREALRKVRHLTDGLGMPVDREIVETVAILRLMDLNTTMSCAGHLSRITNGPYIIFTSLQARGYEAKRREVVDSASAEYKRLVRKSIKLNLLERQKLLPYLEHFYEHRNVSYGQRLTIRSLGYSSNILYCQGADMAHLSDRAEKRKILNRNRAELDAFASFLEMAYFRWRWRSVKH